MTARTSRVGDLSVATKQRRDVVGVVGQQNLGLAETGEPLSHRSDTLDHGRFLRDPFEAAQAVRATTPRTDPLSTGRDIGCGMLDSRLESWRF
jgi:hypothetical protein